MSTLHPKRCPGLDLCRGCGAHPGRKPPPIPPRRTRAETVPYPDDLRIALRTACMPVHPRVVPAGAHRKESGS